MCGPFIWIQALRPTTASILLLPPVFIAVPLAATLSHHRHFPLAHPAYILWHVPQTSRQDYISPCSLRFHPKRAPLSFSFLPTRQQNMADRSFSDKYAVTNTFTVPALRLHRPRCAYFSLQHPAPRKGTHADPPIHPPKLSFFKSSFL